MDCEVIAKGYRYRGMHIIVEQSSNLVQMFEIFLKDGYIPDSINGIKSWLDMHGRSAHN